MNPEVERLMPDPDRRDDALERVQATVDLAPRIWPTLFEPHLSPTQKRVVECLSRGLGIDGTAETLGMSPHTVREHVRRGMERLKAKNQAQLVAEALRNGLIR